MKGKVMEAVIMINGMMSDSVKKSLDDVNKRLGLIDKSALATAAKLTAVGVAAATAAGAMVGTFIKGGNEYIRTMNGISAQTGAGGEELKEFGDIAREVWKSGKGENFQEVADALVNIEQASGLAGEELKAAANAGMLLKDTFGKETQETTRGATALMKNFGLTAEEAYGIIAVGIQNGADKNGDLLDTLNEYSVHYKALGLDADQFVTSLIKGAEAGSFSIDKVGDAVKEFTIRSKDASKTSMDAYAQIGLDGELMTKAFAAGGEAAEAAFFQTVNALKAMQDPVAKNQAGVALFGTMFEDLEAGVLDTLGSMSTANVDAAEALRKMEQVKYKDIGYAVTQISRSFQDELIPSAEQAGQAVYEQMPAIRESIKEIGPIVGELGSQFAAALPGIIENIAGVVRVAMDFANVIAGNWGWIGPVIAGVVAGLMAFKVIGSIMAIYTAVTTGASVATAVFGAALAVVTSPAFLIAAAIGAVVAVGILLYKNWDTIKAKGAELWAYLGTVWAGIKDGAATMTQGVVDFFSNAFAALPGILKAPINAAISLVNGAINGINAIGFVIPDWVPGIGGKAFKLNIPNIPMLAAGGFTNGVSIAGEAGQEAVISFDPAYRSQNIGYLAQAAEKLGVGDEMGLNYYADKIASLGNSGLAGVTNITYDLGGIVFSPTVTISGVNEKKADVIEQLRNYQGDLLELIEELLASKEAGNYGTGGVF